MSYTCNTVESLHYGADPDAIFCLEHGIRRVYALLEGRDRACRQPDHAVNRNDFRLSAQLPTNSHEFCEKNLNYSADLPSPSLSWPHFSSIVNRTDFCLFMRVGPPAGQAWQY